MQCRWSRVLAIRRASGRLGRAPPILSVAINTPVRRVLTHSLGRHRDIATGARSTCKELLMEQTQHAPHLNVPRGMVAPETGRRANASGRVRRPCLTAAPRLADTRMANFRTPKLHRRGLRSLIGQILGQEMQSNTPLEPPEVPAVSSTPGCNTKHDCEQCA